MTEAKDRIRTDRAALLAALREAGADIRNEKQFKCPFHDDRNPSAGIYQGDDGAWHFKCHGCGFGGDVFDVREKDTGKSVPDQLRELGEHDRPARKEPARTFPSIEAWENSFSHRVATYRYTNPDTGKIDLLKCRIEPPDRPKWFSQARIDDSGTVHAEAPPKPHPIYNRTRVRKATEVIVVEGEKCVEAITRAGYVATTAATGGNPGTASLTNWSPLAGKNVYLWPDHDSADEETGLRKGHQFMKEVKEHLCELDPPAKIWWINPDLLNLGDKEDAADYLARFPETPADAIGDAIDIAVPLDGTSELRTHISQIMSGKRTNQKLTSFPVFTTLARPLLPGGVLVIVGDPGTTKSLLVTQILIDLIVGGGSSASCFMLEDDRNFHMKRVLAQITGNASMTLEEWMQEHQAEVEDALDTHSKELDRIVRSMSDAPDTTLSYPKLTDWTDKAAAKSRVVIVDPITAIDSGERQWSDERNFMVKAKAALRRNLASMIIVTHPRGAQTRGGVDDLAGSRAFGRFAQTVVWLKRHNKPKSVSIAKKTSNATIAEHHWIDRELRLVKVRNGIGQGARIGLQFDTKTLRFKELGLILEDASDE